MTPSRTTIVLALLVLSLPAAAPPAFAGGLLKQLAGTLADAVGEELAATSEEILDTARVQSVDTSIRPSVVVRTDDGGTFQLLDLGFVSAGWLNRVLSRVERIDLEGGGDGHYRLELHYRDRDRKQGAGAIFKRVAGSTAEKLVASRIADQEIPLHGLAGTALDGSRWFMLPSNHRLDSIEFLH